MHCTLHHRPRRENKRVFGPLLYRRSLGEGVVFSCLKISSDKPSHHPRNGVASFSTRGIKLFLYPFGQDYGYALEVCGSVQGGFTS